MCSAGYAVRAAREALPGRLLRPHPLAAVRQRGKHVMALGSRHATSTAQFAGQKVAAAQTLNATLRPCAKGGDITARSNASRSPTNTTCSTPRVRAV